MRIELLTGLLRGHRWSKLRLVALGAISMMAIPSSVFAGGRQLHGSVLGGGALLSTPVELFAGGAVAGQLGYGITDAFRVYGHVEYRFGLSMAAMSSSLAHLPSVAVGFGYSLDVLSVVPWIAVELRAGVRLHHSGGVAFVPGAGGRVGVDWLIRRYFSLTFQGSYTLSFVDAGLAHDASVLIGPRWVLDL